MLDLERLRSGLINLGFRPTDSVVPSTLQFMYEGGSYYLEIDEKDDQYVRVGFPGFFTVTQDKHVRALKVANKVTESIKAVKVFIFEDKVYCSVEQFVRDEDEILRFLTRYLIVMQGAAKAFVTQYSNGD